MDLEGIMLCEIDEEKYFTISFMCGIKKKKKKQLIVTESRFVVACSRGGREPFGQNR